MASRIKSMRKSIDRRTELGNDKLQDRGETVKTGGQILRKTQVTAYLPNKVGALATAAKALAAAKINIEGISLAETADMGEVRMLVSDADKAEMALARAGIGYSKQAVEVVQLKDKPGSLAKFAAKLAKVGVDIHYVYGSTCAPDESNSCRLVVSASDLNKVKRIAG
jgi:hypothetical protein